MNKNIFFQLCRFGVVGLTAAIVHFGIVVLLVETAHMKPLIANVIAFMCAFQVTYYGNRFWTFKDTVISHRVAFPKLLFVSTCGFVANESMFYVLLTYFFLPYPLALFIVLSVLPILTFVLTKVWVFRNI